MNARGLVLLVALFFTSLNVQAQYRTVIDKKIGSVFQVPAGFSYSEYGAFDGSAPSGSLDPNALLIRYGRFLQAGPGDATSAMGGFPYSALRTYESQQIAAGKAPIFITATYEGKSRPVLFSWTLKLVNGVPTAPSSSWQYAINVQDSRYVHFWINNYARAVVLNAAYSTRNVWIQLDQSAFNTSIFGVLDDTNHFVSGVTWDSPFPQTPGAYLASIASFFQQLSEQAPDIKVIPNAGTISDPTQLTTIFANIPGVILENIYSWKASPTAYTRNAWAAQNFVLLPWMASQNRVALLRALIPPTDSTGLLTSFVVYSLLKGPNFFFSPGNSSNNESIPPSEWQSMEALLGNPTSTMQRRQQTGMNTSDTGAAGSFHPLLVLSAIPESTVSVSYTVEQPNGTSTTGTATFLPGENYRYFNVTATGSLGQIATVRLNSASGAIVGSKDIFSITIN